MKMNSQQSSESGESKVPPDLSDALSALPPSEAAWHNLTLIGRRDYISWINEAKQAETRKRRIERCCESIITGKKRPCCFAVVPMDFYKALGNTPEAKAQWSTLSPSEKRDITDWINDSDSKDIRKTRVAEACFKLESGERFLL